jgi:uncharacterized delta-60 repeat protein
MEIPRMFTPLRTPVRKSARRRSKDRSKIRLRVEQLEDRRLMALVSSWQGEGNALDSVGPNHGTMLNGATFGTGVFGQAFEFDGIDDQFTAPTAGLPTGNASRTVALWTRIDAETTGEAFFASYGAAGTPGGVFALGRQSDLVFVTQWGQAVSGGNLDPSTWHHIAATLESGNLFRLYVDGVQVSSGTMSISTPAGSTFYLGQQQAPYGDSRKLDGRVDEVSVHDVALTASEIQALFVAGGTGSPTATDDAYSVRMDTSLNIPAHGVLANDVGQIAVLDSGPLHGTLTLSPNGGFNYTPAAGYTGPDSFTYHAVNGAGNSNTATVAITVAPSFLDPTFDGDGMAVVDAGLGRADEAYDLAIQADGKIVVVGKFTSSNKGDEWAVARLNPNGSLDTSFGSGGIVHTSFGSKHDFAQGAGIQADGKIVVGGYANVSNKNTFAMARYNTNGTLDTSFDGDGKLTTNVVSLSEGIRDIVIQPDGKIVAVGYAEVSSGVSDMALVRYNTNGSLDTSFGTGGKVVTPGTNHARAVALTPGGKIVVVGHADPGEGIVARYNANGTLDTTLSGNGLIERSGAITSGLYLGVAVQVDGKIVAADIDSHAVVRFTDGGGLDAGFAGDGTADIPVNDAWDVAVQSDGKIVAAGQGNLIAGEQMAVFRMNADGSPDTAFATAGLADAIFPAAQYSWAKRVAIQGDGKIVAAGGFVGNTSGSPRNFAIARFEGDPPAAAASGAAASDSDIALMLFLAGEDAARRKRR